MKKVDPDIRNLKEQKRIAQERIESEKQQINYGLERLRAVPPPSDIAVHSDRSFRNGTYNRGSVPYPRFLYEMAIICALASIFGFLGGKIILELPINEDILPEMSLSIILVLLITFLVGGFEFLRKGVKCRFCGFPLRDFERGPGCGVCGKAYSFGTIEETVRESLEASYQKFAKEVEEGGISQKNIRCEKCGLPMKMIDLGPFHVKTTYCPSHGTNSQMMESDSLKSIEATLKSKT